MRTDLPRRAHEIAAGTPPLAGERVKELLGRVSGWSVEKNELVRTFQFQDYYEAVAFVNATAWVSHAQDHHPMIELGYNTVKMRYSTHSVGGLSENDFICAREVNGLLAEAG